MVYPKLVGPSRVTAAHRAQVVALVARYPEGTDDPVSPLARRQLWVAVGRGKHAPVLACATLDQQHDAAGRTVAAKLLSCIVAPKARGQGLQRRLLRARLASLRSVARAQGRSFTATTCARVENKYSRANILAVGFEQLRVVNGFAYYEETIECP